MFIKNKDVCTVYLELSTVPSLYLVHSTFFFNSTFFPAASQGTYPISVPEDNISPIKGPVSDARAFTDK